MNTPIANIIAKMKRMYDYDIVDSDLDQLLLDCINDGLKILIQWLKDRGIDIHTGRTLTLTTTASQAYVDLQPTPDALTAALAGSGAGNVEDGAHGYKVTFVTSEGESLPSSAVSVTVADKTTNGKVALSAIPISKLSDVTSRKVYRTVAGGSTYKLLATISDNTTTTYTDNIADASLGADSPTVNTMLSYDIIKLTERTNDRPIPIIPYDEFIGIYPDPTANSASTPDRAAIYNNRVYFGPTPSGAISIYAEHLMRSTEYSSTTSGNLPVDSYFDPLLISIARVFYLQWFDSNDASAIALARAIRDDMKQDLLMGSSFDRGKVRQCASRNDYVISGPRIPES